MHASGDRIRPRGTSDSLKAAHARAAAATRDYQAAMAIHGGSSGSYVVVEWNRPARDFVLGHVADAMPRVARM